MAIKVEITCNACGKQDFRQRNAKYCKACAVVRGRQQREARALYYRLAHQYVQFAVSHGDLPKLDGSIICADCSNPATEYDHRDYKKPLEVDPVCRFCNAARGPGLHRDPSETGTKPLSIRQRFELKAA